MKTWKMKGNTVFKQRGQRCNQSSVKTGNDVDPLVAPWITHYIWLEWEVQQSQRGELVQSALERNMWVCARPLSRVQLFVTPQTAAHQAPLSMGILQARVLELVSMPSPRGSSQHWDQTQVSELQADTLLSEPPGMPKKTGMGSLSFLQGIFLTHEANLASPALQADSLSAELPGKPGAQHTWQINQKSRFGLSFRCYQCGRKKNQILFKDWF